MADPITPEKLRELADADGMGVWIDGSDGLKRLVHAPAALRAAADEIERLARAQPIVKPPNVEVEERQLGDRRWGVFIYRQGEPRTLWERYETQAEALKARKEAIAYLKDRAANPAKEG